MTKRKEIRISFEGKPTKRDLAAIRKAVTEGLLRDGDCVQAISYRKNPTDAREAFRSFHWGRPPRGARKVTLPDYGELFVLGKLRAVEYETKKGRTRAIWCHDFERPYPERTATPDGQLGPIVGGGAYVTSRGIER